MDMDEITGVTTRLIKQDGLNLCNHTACSSSPCLNGGSCDPQNTTAMGYSCTCRLGYEGVNCEKDMDECSRGSIKGVKELFQ